VGVATAAARAHVFRDIQDAHHSLLSGGVVGRGRRREREKEGECSTHNHHSHRNPSNWLTSACTCTCMRPHSASNYRADIHYQQRILLTPAETRTHTPSKQASPHTLSPALFPLTATLAKTGTRMPALPPKTRKPTHSKHWDSAIRQTHSRFESPLPHM
jgi:hypothetical protein